MSLPFLNELPAPDDWPSWLEGHLLGLELGDLVVELTALGERVGHRDPLHRPPELDELLGDDFPAVLEEGLSVLSLETLEELLRYPSLLLKLQERVLLEGGLYWQRVPLSMDHKDQVEQSWLRLEALLPVGAGAEGDWQQRPTVLGETSHTIEVAWPTDHLLDSIPGPAPEPLASDCQFACEPEPEVSAEAIIQSVETIQPAWPAGRGKLGWAGLLSAAAAVLLLVWQPWSPRPQPWGFNHPGALAASDHPAEYLQQLANAGEEWFAKRPTDPRGLQIRLTSFVKGCDALLQAEHAVLSAADREFLLEQCRQCRDTLAGQLARLESSADLALLQAESDRAVRKLIDHLRQRAAELRAA